MTADITDLQYSQSRRFASAVNMPHEVLLDYKIYQGHVDNVHYRQERLNFPQVLHGDFRLICCHNGQYQRVERQSRNPLGTLSGV